MTGAGRLSRAGRRTNLSLLALLTAALATGTASYAVGAAPATTLVTGAHAVVGLAVLLLVPWKQAVARRGLRRRPHPGRAAGLVLALLLAVTVAAGVVQTTVGWTTNAVLTPLQVHVGAALLAVPLLAAHLVSHWQRPRAVDASRRTFLAAALLGAGGVAGLLGIDRATRALSLPGADDLATGSTERGSFAPTSMPVTQWFTDAVPSRTQRDVPLRVAVADRVVEVDVEAMELDERQAVLDCTGGWYAVQRWQGVSLDRLLPSSLPPGVRSLDVVSVTGYRRRFPLHDAPSLLLATSIGGVPLSPGHGAPRRLVAPGRRGFWWVKWVVAVEVSEAPPWMQPLFPLQ